MISKSTPKSKVCFSQTSFALNNNQIPYFCSPMKKVAFYTLGCKLNFSETSSISRMFEDRGYQKVDFLDTPDIFIINTCSVTDNADKKCRKIVREARALRGSLEMLSGEKRGASADAWEAWLAERAK